MSGEIVCMTGGFEFVTGGSDLFKCLGAQKTGRPFHDLPIEVYGIGPKTYLQYLYNPVGSRPFTIEINRIP